MTSSYHAFIRVTSWWARWHLKSPAWRLFTQSFVQVQIKENVIVSRHWPLCGEGNSPEFPTQKASNAEKASFDDVIMLFQGASWTDRLLWRLYANCRWTFVANDASYQRRYRYDARDELVFGCQLVNKYNIWCKESNVRSWNKPPWDTAGWSHWRAPSKARKERVEVIQFSYCSINCI